MWTRGPCCRKSRKNDGGFSLAYAELPTRIPWTFVPRHNIIEGNLAVRELRGGDLRSDLEDTLPSLKQTVRTWEIGHPQRKCIHLIFQPSNLRCKRAVCFREGKPGRFGGSNMFVWVVDSKMNCGEPNVFRLELFKFHDKLYKFRDHASTYLGEMKGWTCMINSMRFPLNNALFSIGSKMTPNFITESYHLIKKETMVQPEFFSSKNT